MNPKNYYHKYKEVILYLIFGGLTTVVSIVSFAYCNIILKQNALLANLVSWILAVTFAYVTNRLFVFRHKAHDPKAIIIEVMQFFSGRLATLLIEEALLFVFIEWFHMPALLIKAGAQFIVLVSNYLISKYIVFKK